MVVGCFAWDVWEIPFFILRSCILDKWFRDKFGGVFLSENGSQKTFQGKFCEAKGLFWTQV